MPNLIVKNIFTEISTTLATGVALSIGISFTAFRADAASLIQESLFFGRDIPSGGEVSDRDFQTFLNNIITPRFPNGLTVFDANGQYLYNTGNIIQEKSKYVTLFIEDTPKNQASIYDISQAYNQQFNQESVLRVSNKGVNVSFGLGDLFQNSPSNEFIKTDLYFGRDIPGDGEVSNNDFQTFLNNVITPRFPDGLTVFDANGQYLDSTGTIIKEKSKDVTLFFTDTSKNQASIYDVVSKYTQEFNQESVLQVADEDVKVSFDPSDILNDTPTNKFIRTDLYFGRDIPGGGEVSNNDFQSFLNNVVTPLFPDGLTVFDANGQYLDSTGNIIEEKSKSISLFFNDTQQNKNSIYNIINKYTQRFNQESVLQVVDENVNVSFITASQPVTIPESSFAWGLVALGILGTGSVLKKKIVKSTTQRQYVTVAEWMLNTEAQVCVDKPVIEEFATQGKRI
ncbi:MAG: DUF3574 domain-containing protein [Nostoc sp.]|uniref:DUF3574 domain-containing protein n=1 Tax=Nostoc sp. TaxID=1180 RepID=UPI002FF4857A